MRKVKLKNTVELNLNNFESKNGVLFEKLHNNTQPNSLNQDENNQNNGIKISLSELTVTKVIDIPERKIVYVEFLETAWPLTIWKDETYDEAGQWTDDQLNAAVDELVGTLTGNDLEKMMSRMRPQEKLTVNEIEKFKSSRLHPMALRMLFPMPKPPIIHGLN